MRKTLDFSISYIEQVDDENFLTQLMSDRDYSNRDSLRIAQELELLEMVLTPKI